MSKCMRSLVFRNFKLWWFNEIVINYVNFQTYFAFSGKCFFFVKCLKKFRQKNTSWKPSILSTHQNIMMYVKIHARSLVFRNFKIMVIQRDRNYLCQFSNVFCFFWEMFFLRKNVSKSSDRRTLLGNSLFYHPTKI